MNDLNLMTPEELQKHIEKCQAILESKKKEKVNRLIGNLTNAAQALLNECPFATLNVKYYSEECEDNIDVCIELEDLTNRNNYKV